MIVLYFFRACNALHHPALAVIEPRATSVVHAVMFDMLAPFTALVVIEPRATSDVRAVSDD